MPYSRRVRTKSLLTSIFAVGATLLGLRLLYNSVTPAPPRTAPRPLSDGGRDLLPCAHLPGAKDVLVVMKTGSTELQDKLPVHFHTTIQCYPNFLLFSDLEEYFEGHHIHDALQYVDPVVQQSNEDFELWRRLQAQGRFALQPGELSGPESRVSPMTGKGSNPGWKLDKWKFLPMVNTTLSLYPDMKWYMFIETDTYVFWSTALAWIATLPSDEPWYMGSQMQIGDVVFAHGGSGFLASNAALQLVVNFFLSNQQEWEKFTDLHWAGDCVLGKAFSDAGSPLTWAWPIVQGLKPSAVDYKHFDYGKRLWCYPSMSYHHLSPTEVEDIWRFEQEWMLNTTDIVRHSDVFRHYILPRIRDTEGSKSGWDNLSGEFPNMLPADSVEECRARCQAEEKCVQFAFSKQKCATSISPKWGEPNPDAESGWILHRIDHFLANMEPCANEKWVTD